jgi:hypothetical protein
MSLNGASQAFVIEKNVPLPKNPGRRGGRGGGIYPFDALEVGDSVVISGAKINSMMRAASLWAKRRGKRVCTRKISETSIRVWRFE